MKYVQGGAVKNLKGTILSATLIFRWSRHAEVGMLS